MNANPATNPLPQNRIHPLVAGAAVAVTLFCTAGIAALTGILPTSRALTAPAMATQPGTPSLPQPVAATPLAPQSSYAQGPSSETLPARPRVYRHASAPRVPASHYVARDTYPVQAAPRPVAVDPNAGRVVSVMPVQTAEQPTGLGAVGGALAGGLLGNQIGQGRGRTLATVAGALVGGLAGNGIEHAVRKETSYEVQVRMEDGSYRSFTYQTPPAVQVGERVHVSGDSLSAA